MKYIVSFTIFVLLGVLFLGEGITGFVAAGNAQLTTSNAVHYLWLFVGAKLIIFFAFLLYRRIRKKEVILSKIFKRHKQNL